MSSPVAPPRAPAHLSPRDPAVLRQLLGHIDVLLGDSAVAGAARDYLLDGRREVERMLRLQTAH